MRYVLAIFCVAVALVALNSCAGYGPYRFSKDDIGCQPEIALGSANIEHSASSPHLNCSLQTQILPVAYSTSPAAIGAPQEPDRFHLAFAELGNGVSKEVLEKQMSAIQSHLGKTKKDFIVVFVHGWRHNADIGDLDIKRFRTLLAYSRSFLNSRCEQFNRYCDAILTGVFVGWRGASYAEPPEDTSLLSDIGAGPTFWARKAESERRSADLLDIVRRISSKPAQPGDFESDKVMVVGHSSGGNMIANAVRKGIIDRLSEHPMGGYFQPPLGDLTVLINPASEAENWTAIQEKLAEKAGKPIVARQNEPTDNLEKVFSAYQRPGYISLTSACDWTAEERTDGRRARCDVPTGYLFPLGQWAALKWKREQYKAIGHLDPEYEPRYEKGPKEPNRFAIRLGTRRVGTSHELITNKGSDLDTSYEAGSTREGSQCDVADGWLSKVQERQRAKMGTSYGWDTSYIKGQEESLLFVDSKRGLSVQIRHRLSPNGRKAGELPSIAPTNSPFWNVRAFDTAIAEHKSYVNYPLWCTLNQLVLDDVVAKHR